MWRFMIKIFAVITGVTTALGLLLTTGRITRDKTVVALEIVCYAVPFVISLIMGIMHPDTLARINDKYNALFSELRDNLEDIEVAQEFEDLK